MPVTAGVSSSSAGFRQTELPALHIVKSTPRRPPLRACDWRRFLAPYKLGEWQNASEAAEALCAVEGEAAPQEEVCAEAREGEGGPEPDDDESGAQVDEGRDGRMGKETEGREDAASVRTSMQGRSSAGVVASLRTCTARESGVRTSQGEWMDSLEFYRRFGIFAPPRSPAARTRKRMAALRRHGFNGPQQRPCVERYVRHAQAVFGAEYVSVSVLCTDGVRMLRLTSVGGRTDLQGAYAMADTVCAHASLLDDSSVMVVPDLEKDWRFSNIRFEDGNGTKLRSYASAPVLVTTPPDVAEMIREFENEVEPEAPAADERGGRASSEGLISIGRLTVLRRDPWDVTQAEAELLRDIALMCGEAIDNDWQRQNRIRLKRMQAETARMARMIESEVAPHRADDVASPMAPGYNARVDAPLSASSSSSTMAGADASLAGRIGQGVKGDPELPKATTASDGSISLSTPEALDPVDVQMLRVTENVGRSILTVLEADAFTTIDVSSLRFAPTPRSSRNAQTAARLRRAAESGAQGAPPTSSRMAAAASSSSASASGSSGSSRPGGPRRDTSLSSPRTSSVYPSMPWLQDAGGTSQGGTELSPTEEICEAADAMNMGADAAPPSAAVSSAPTASEPLSRSTSRTSLTSGRAGRGSHKAESSTSSLVSGAGQNAGAGGWGLSVGSASTSGGSSGGAGDPTGTSGGASGSGASSGGAGPSASPHMLRASLFSPLERGSNSGSSLSSSGGGGGGGGLAVGGGLGGTPSFQAGHKRSSSSFQAGITGGDLECWLETTQGPRLLCHQGDPNLAPLLDADTSKAVIVAYFKERRNQLRIQPTPIVFTTEPTAWPPLPLPEDGSGRTSRADGGGAVEAATAKGVAGEAPDPEAKTTASSEDEEIVEPSHPLALLMPPPDRPKSHLCIPTYDIEGQPLYLLIITIDGDRLVDAGDALFVSACAAVMYSSRLRFRAQQADRVQLDFLRSVSHEMRTPLNAILGITDLMRQGISGGEGPGDLDLSEDGVLASLLESIRLAGSTLTSTLDDVLDLGAVTGLRSANRGQRIEEVKLCREVEEVCMDELEYQSLRLRQEGRLADGKLLMSRQLSNTPVLVIHFAPELCARWRVDRSAMRKILAKLISNALRFTGEGGLVEVKVRLSPVPRTNSSGGSSVSSTNAGGAGGGGWGSPSSPTSLGPWNVEFIISDTGQGMSSAFVRTELLAPFVKGNTFTQGVGLGATIAASLTARLGGRFDVQSELGRGTRICVTLPLTPLQPRDMTVRAAAEGATRFATAATPLTTPSEPLQVHSVFFLGFITPSLDHVKELLRRRLHASGVRLCPSVATADLIIIAEPGLATVSELPRELAAARQGDPARMVRVVLVTSDVVGYPAKVEVLEGLPAHMFRPPVGPTSLDQMDAFLRETDPSRLTLRLPRPFTPRRESRDPAMAAPALPTSNQVTPTIAQTARAADGTPPLVASLSATAESADTCADDIEFRVLVVEDNPVNKKLLTTLLSRLKIRFAEAHDGVEAVEVYAAFRPSVVLLDISLPLQDGFAACTLMRAHPLPHTPRIVAVTALSSHEDKARGIALGMNEWRTKPVSIKALRADLISWQEEWLRAVSSSPSVALAAAEAAEGSSESTSVSQSSPPAQVAAAVAAA